VADEECEDCGWADCEGDCVDDEPDDDAGHGDGWQPVDTGGLL
jgi:hypothetical protein